MRNFKVHDIEVGKYGPVDEEFYRCNLGKWTHTINMFGDDGIVMLNRDLACLDRRAKASGDEELAAQVRALYDFILEVM